MNVRIAAMIVSAASLLGAASWAQETPPPGFAEAVGLCRDAMLARVPLADLPAAQTALVEASPEVRAAHPLGGAPHMWVLPGRAAADITVLQLDPKSCNVYAINANIQEAFDSSAALLTSSGFVEGETEQRRTGGIERNFRSADRNVRVELQTFGEGSATEPPASGVITMALFGRRR